MRILITTDWNNTIINGVVNSVTNLVSELRKKGHEVKIITLSEDRHHRCEGDVYYIPSVNIGKIYPHARASIYYHSEYIDEIIRWHPNVVHSQCEFITFVYAKKIAETLGIPIIHTYHTVYEDYTHYILPSKTIGRKAVATFSRNILKDVQAVIAPTEKVGDLLAEYGVESPIHTIPTGIDLNKFNISFSQKQKDNLKQKLGIPKGNIVLVNIGRLAKEKNLDEIIEYIYKMDKANISLLIVGDGPYRDKLKKRVQQLNLYNRVIFTGMISSEEVSSYYQLGDIFVSASNSETQGLTYIEALASGLPSVCKQDPCIKNVIIDGYNGFQYNSYETFKDSINYILTNSETYNNFSMNARISSQGYSTEVFANKVESLYENLITESDKYEQVCF